MSVGLRNIAARRSGSADCPSTIAPAMSPIGSGKTPPSPREGYSAPLLLRFAVDDLKAYCLEAAAAGAGKPSSRQLGDWFWNESAAGEMKNRSHIVEGQVAARDIAVRVRVLKDAVAFLAQSEDEVGSDESIRAGYENGLLFHERSQRAKIRC